MNYSIKVVTFNVKPEVRSGLESEIMFSQCFQYKGTDQFPLERGLENNCLCNMWEYPKQREMNSIC